MHRLHLAPAVAVALIGAGLGLLTGCGGADPATYNDADVTFANEMVTHHEQAVAMVDLTDDRQVDAAFRTLADGIRDAQEPEITRMTGWLKQWGKPSPSDGATATDSGDDDAMGDMSMGGSMAGMMSEEEMQQLADAPAATFEQQWLTLMIRHHQGAVSMARTEIADGEDPDAVALARRISDTQAGEITEMQSMLTP